MVNIVFILFKFIIIILIGQLVDSKVGERERETVGVGLGKVREPRFYLGMPNICIIYFYLKSVEVQDCYGTFINSFLCSAHTHSQTC